MFLNTTDQPLVNQQGEKQLLSYTESAVIRTVLCDRHHQVDLARYGLILGRWTPDAGQEVGFGVCATCGLGSIGLIGGRTYIFTRDSELVCLSCVGLHYPELVDAWFHIQEREREVDRVLRAAREGHCKEYWDELQRRMAAAPVPVENDIPF
jgi:hypothetical protein